MEVLYLKFSSKEEAYEKLADFRDKFEDPDGTITTYWKDKPSHYLKRPFLVAWQIYCVPVLCFLLYTTVLT